MTRSTSNKSSRPTRRRRAAVGMIRTLPSIFTLGNLLCGFAAVFYASRPMVVDDQPNLALGHWSPLTVAAAIIFVGMIFDALDGRIARITRQTSELGGQLDSMADMVTFGVAPAFLMIQLIGIGTPFFGEVHPRWDIYFDRAVLLVAAAYVACCALRLARFNIEIELPSEADHLSFKGLPSPAAAGTVASLVLLHQSLLTGSRAALATALGMVAVTLLVALAMVSNMRYVHLMNRYLKGRAPFHYITTSVFILIALLIRPQIALAAGFTIYALSSPTMAVTKIIHRKRSTGS